MPHRQQLLLLLNTYWAPSMVLGLAGHGAVGRDLERSSKASWRRWGESCHWTALALEPWWEHRRQACGCEAGTETQGQGFESHTAFTFSSSKLGRRLQGLGLTMTMTTTKVMVFHRGHPLNAYHGPGSILGAFQNEYHLICTRTP